MNKIDIPFDKNHRYELIDKMIHRTQATSYLEIGCDKNQIFDLITVPYKIGVDPIKGGNIRSTSDEFFEKNQDTFDVIFVDGLHHYDQVTKDINNSLAVLKSTGYIIIHDMLPTSKEEANMPWPLPGDQCKQWLGDVWRSAFDLAGRTDITFKLVLIDCGCGIITKYPQEPKHFEVDNSWEWYSNNWNKLPLVRFDEI